MDALQALASDKYRQDIISNNIGKKCLYEVSLSEYRTASRRLGEVPDDRPFKLYSRRNSSVFIIISKLLGELPIVCSLPPFFLLFKI